MDTRELLTQLEKLECGLDSFSFTELKSSEASRLKKSFQSFRDGLEEKVFGPPTETSKQVDAIKVSDNPSSESQLIANVSHEIRTPLNGIIGFLDLMKETELTGEQFELVKAMGSASNNLMMLINELLAFSKLATGGETFEKIPFNPNNLIDEVAFLGRTLIKNNPVELFVNYDVSIPESILGDPSKLSQVLLNLMGNAIKFVEKGEIGLDVNLKEENSKKVYLEFVVRDTGIGIANDQLKHIFDTYRQAEPSTKLKYGGAGLGLSIVKEIIEKQHGCIAVSSTLGKGTTFKVILPFDKVKDAPKQKKPLKHKKNQPNISGTSILIFEDDALTQKLMENRMDHWGCKSYITENGLYGLELLENEKIDLVLLDMRLPGMNGFEIVKRIKENSNLKDLPIIALSADYHFLENGDLEEWGINDFVLKPYNANELLEKIDANINKMNENTTKEMVKEAGPVESTEKLVDLTPILQECLGKTELLDELIRLFEQNILEFIGKTKMHLQSRNLQGVGFAAHKIKSSLRMLHAEGLIGICEEMILECRTTNNLEHLKTLFEAFVAEYPKVEMQIGVELKRVKYKL